MDTTVNTGTPYISPDKKVRDYDKPGKQKQAAAEADALVSYLRLVADGDGLGDPVCLAMILQVRKLNQAVSGKLKEVQHLSNLKDALGKKTDKLRQIKQYMEATGKDEISIEELNDIFNGTRQAPANEQELQDLIQKSGLLDSQFTVDPLTGAVTEDGGMLYGNIAPGLEVLKKTKIKKANIDEGITKITDQSERITGSIEIELIKLNDLISKKGQAIQLLSNVQKKNNDTQQAVIANFK